MSLHRSRCHRWRCGLGKAHPVHSEKERDLASVVSSKSVVRFYGETFLRVISKSAGRQFWMGLTSWDIGASGQPLAQTERATRAAGQEELPETCLATCMIKRLGIATAPVSVRRLCQHWACRLICWRDDMAEQTTHRARRRRGSCDSSFNTRSSTSIGLPHEMRLQAGSFQCQLYGSGALVFALRGIPRRSA